MTAAVWCGADTAGAPLVAHLVHLGPRAGKEPGLRPVRVSACGGERRRAWQTVDWFANPAAFTRCPACAALAEPQ